MKADVVIDAEATFDEKVTTIKWLMKKDPALSVVLVEGDDDSRLFRAFFSSDRCAVEFFRGKDNVIEAFEKLMRVTGLDTRRLVAIVDADFDHLFGRGPEHKNVFMTDTHDIETMILNSPALDRVLVEYADHAKLKRLLAMREKTLPQCLLDAAFPIGGIFIVRRGRGLLRIGDFELDDMLLITDTERLNTDVYRLCDLILSRNRECRFTKESLVTELEVLRKSGRDLWQVCRGHDMVKILLIGLQRTFGRGHAKRLPLPALNGNLRMCYAQAFFESTRLYKAIREWERNNPPFVVLRRGE